jgi:3-oxoacyl-[acyl-carrier protein] reductase
LDKSTAVQADFLIALPISATVGQACIWPASMNRTDMAQTSIVTGCASGIGKQLAAELYRRGHRLVLTDVNREGLERAAEEGGIVDRERALLRHLDVRDATRWDALMAEAVERFGRLDLVFNVAGFLTAVWAKDASPADVDRTIDVNVKGLMYGTNAAVKVMVGQRSGHVVNIASMAALVPVPGLAIYSASKHAARAYSIAVGQEVREYGVYVTAVCPTVVATPMMDIQIDREEAALTFSGRRPLSVEEVTRAIVERAMVEKPLELVLDAGGGQGVMSKLGNVFPELFFRVGQRVRKRGQLQQSRIRNGP